MMRFLATGLLVLLLAAPCAALEPDTLTVCRETVRLCADGRAEVSLCVGPLSPGPDGVLLPCSYAHARNVTVEAAGGRLVAELVARGGADFIDLRSAAPLAPLSSVTVTYVATGVFDPATARTRAFGNVDMEYAFVNSTRSRMAPFSAELELPPGWVVGAVGDVYPPPSKNSPAPPYTLSMRSGRHVIGLSRDSLAAGERMSVTWRQKSGQKPWLLLVGMVLVGVLYLVFFRDVLEAPQAPSSSDPRPVDAPTAPRVDLSA